jgi:microsomal dipeptidase-like Zn-dependent dipeptidase
VIGINLFMPFVGMDFSKNLVSHIEHGLNLGGENALCFGADFFCDNDFPDLIAKYTPNTPFFPAFADASKYPDLLQMLQERLGLSQQLLKKISSENASQFLRSSF